MLGTSLLWRSTVAFTYLKVKFAKCLCVLPVVLYLDLVYRQLSAQPPHRLLPLNHFCLDCHSVCIPFIDYVQRSSSCLYRRLRYRNCLNYITLHYIVILVLVFRIWSCLHRWLLLPRVLQMFYETEASLVFIYSN